MRVSEKIREVFQANLRGSKPFFTLLLLLLFSSSSGGKDVINGFQNNAIGKTKLDIEQIF
jgi:hypothetical protein